MKNTRILGKTCAAVQGHAHCVHEEFIGVLTPCCVYEGFYGKLTSYCVDEGFVGTLAP